MRFQSFGNYNKDYGLVVVTNTAKELGQFQFAEMPLVREVCHDT